MKALPILAFAALLTGCAANDYAAYTATQQAIATAKAQADTARYQALATIASTGTDSARVAAVMALALGNGQASSSPQIAAPQPNAALQWASLLVPAVTQAVGIRYQYLGQQTASNNATALGISTNAAFVGLGSKIQAPGAVTNNTLSGTGTLGGGSYSLTDRNDTSSPVVQVVPTVITPIVNTPPTVIQPTVLQPVFAPTTPAP